MNIITIGIFRLKRLWQKIIAPLRHTYKANKCGHKTKQIGNIECFGQKNIIEMPLSENGSPDYCLGCIAKMAIRCAWCGNPIVIGDLITLHTPKETFHAPDYAVEYESKVLIGCVYGKCCDSIIDVCGRWLPPGKVERIMSPAGMCIAANQGETEAVIMVGDAENYPESASVYEIK